MNQIGAGGDQGDRRDGDADPVPTEDRQRPGAQERHEPAHSDHCGDERDDGAEQGSSPAVGVEQRSAVLGEIEERGRRQGGEAEQEAELDGGGHRGADRQRGRDGDQAAADAGPEGEDLRGTDDGGMTRGERREPDVAGPRVPPHEEHTADEPGDDDGPRPEQVVLDRVTRDHADRGGGNEGDQQPGQEATAVGVASDGTGGELAESSPVQHDDREDRADLNGDRIRVGGQFAVAVAEVEEPLDDEQVPGRRHGQVLGEPLDAAQDDRLERRERALGVQRQQHHGDKRHHHAGREPEATIPPSSVAETCVSGGGHGRSVAVASTDSTCAACSRRDRKNSMATGINEMATITTAANSRLCFTISISPRK